MPGFNSLLVVAACYLGRLLYGFLGFNGIVIKIHIALPVFYSSATTVYFYEAASKVYTNGILRWFSCNYGSIGLRFLYKTGLFV